MAPFTVFLIAIRKLSRRKFLFLHTPDFECATLSYCFGRRVRLRPLASLVEYSLVSADIHISISLHQLP